MLKCGAQDRYFRFLTLVEVFPTMKKKITEADYWDDFQWTFAKQVKQEKEKAQACPKKLMRASTGSQKKKQVFVL